MRTHHSGVCGNVAVLLSTFLSILSVAAQSGMQVGFYDASCPTVESLVSSTVAAHMNADPSVAAGLLRLHFHDCFVQGCDASVLINGPSSEKTAPANTGLRGFEVIDDAKSQIEAVCPGIVSCADILAFAARDAVSQSGGPSWQVPSGRRDGVISSASNVFLPSPRDTASSLKQKFAAKGLSTQDLVTLSGAHTLGTTACGFFSYRLFNFTATGAADPTINENYLPQLQSLCPPNGNGGVKVPLDKGSQFNFDISYFLNLQAGNGVLGSDQSLMEDSSTQAYINSYTGLLGRLLGSFSSNFANSMIKMSSIEVLTGSDGQIRQLCSSVNQG